MIYEQLSGNGGRRGACEKAHVVAASGPGRGDTGGHQLPGLPKMAGISARISAWWS